MSKLDDLINELCPNGVKYVDFLTVCNYIRGITYIYGIFYEFALLEMPEKAKEKIALQTAGQKLPEK